MKIKHIAVAGLLAATSLSAVPTAAAHHTTYKCSEWHDEALAAGWTEHQLPIVDAIMWRESRCKPEVHNKRGRDDSYGLMQLNMKAHRKWVRPLVDGDFTRLFDPTTNLTVAKALYDRAQEQMKCGWKPWVTRKTRGWCSK